MEVIKSLEGASTEMVERSKTIFFPGDPAERVYLIRRGAVRLSRVYESGEEITVSLLRENSLFGVLSLLTGLLKEIKHQRDYSLLTEKRLFLHLTHKLLTVSLLLFL